jgi:hypothetical protein
MSSPAARAALRREVALCAAASRSEPEFWARLQEAGLLVRRRPDPARPGHPAGHAVTLPGLASRRNRRRTWFAGGTLDKRLTLPAMRARWRAGQPGAAPGPERFAGEDLAEIYRHAAQAARIAARELNSARPQPDIAWAAADLVAAAADATGNPALVQASDGLARACRESWGRIPARSRSGDMLRTTCYLLGACRGNPGWAALIVLITALILLADAIARHREHQQRAAQARAGRDAAAVLTDAAAVLTASTASPAQTPVQVAAKPALRRRPGHLAASRTGPARAPRR